MKHKRIIIILILIIILIGLIITYISINSDNTSIENYEITQLDKSINLSNNKNQSKETTIKQNSEVKSALVEKVEPHATYYLEEIFVEKNQYVEKGANILKYTNGTYLTAPYNCSITEINIPEVEGKFLNTHYIELSSNDVLSISINIDESNINKINIGQEAKINIPTLEKEFTGYVTNIASTANNGKFKTTIEFENNGNIKLGITASVEISID